MRTVQGNLSIAVYFAKLWNCWDELKFLNGLPSCTCGFLGKCTCKVLAKIRELEAQDQMMQFLATLLQLPKESPQTPNLLL